MAPGKNYTPKDKKFGKSNTYSLEQEYRKGIREKPKYTRCRLKKRIKAKSGQEACIYEGNNQTFELIEQLCGSTLTKALCITAARYPPLGVAPTEYFLSGVNSNKFSDFCSIDIAF